MYMVANDFVEDCMFNNSQEFNCINVADTTKLNKSDVSLSIRQACGLANGDDYDKTSVASMIQRRAIGPNFSCGERSRISNNFLPDYMHKIAFYSFKPFCGIYSNDGKFLLVTNDDKFVHLYTVDNGEYNEYKKFDVTPVGWSILDTAFSPDGNYFVYSSWDKFLYLHNIYGDPCVREPLLLCSASDHLMLCVSSVVFSGDGRELFCAGNDGHLYIYDRGSQNCSKVQGHESDINTVAFAEPSSQILYSAGNDGLCKVWDRRALYESNPQPVGILAGHVGAITFVDPRGDGRHLITNSKDQTIKLWDARVFSNRNGLEDARKASASDSWDYRWQLVPEGFSDARKLRDYDTSIMTYRGHMVIQTLIRCRFSPLATTGQRYIYTGCATGRLIIYDVLTGKIVRFMKGHKTVVRDVHWHPFHQEIVSTSWDGVIGSWRYRNENAEDDLRRSHRKRSSRRTRCKTAQRVKRTASA